MIDWRICSLSANSTDSERPYLAANARETSSALSPSWTKTDSITPGFNSIFIYKTGCRLLLLLLISFVELKVFKFTGRRRANELTSFTPYSFCLYSSKGFELSWSLRCDSLTSKLSGAFNELFKMLLFDWLIWTIDATRWCELLRLPSSSPKVKWLLYLFSMELLFPCIKPDSFSDSWEFIDLLLVSLSEIVHYFV